MISLAQGLFMAEAEGYLGPHSDIIPDIIRDASRLIKSGETIDSAIEEAAVLNGVFYGDLSLEEMRRIRQAL